MFLFIFLFYLFIYLFIYFIYLFIYLFFFLLYLFFFWHTLTFRPSSSCTAGDSCETFESGWVVYGPENGYNFPHPRVLRVNPLSPGGTHMVHIKPIFLSTRGLQGLIPSFDVCDVALQVLYCWISFFFFFLKESHW